jgi:CPA2 family monovalent cation:H+ antiporter-2
VLSVLVLEDFAMAAYLPVLTVLAVGGAWWQAGVGMLIAVGAVVGAFAASQRWGSSSAGCCLIPNLSS